jgi:hypothetical protein
VKVPDDPEVSLRFYIERIIDERHKLYQAQFAESEKRVMLALEAKAKDSTDAQWSIGTVLSILVALIALAAVIFKR